MGPWIRGSLREGAALLLGMVAMVAAGPLGLGFGAWSVPVWAVALLAVHTLAVWAGFRTALLLALGIGGSGALTAAAIEAGFQPPLVLVEQAGLTGTVWELGWRPLVWSAFLGAAAWLATDRLAALEDERRSLEDLVRGKRASVRKLEDVVEGLAAKAEGLADAHQRRAKVSARAVSLMSLAKQVLHPGSREAKVAALVEAVADLLHGGRVVLLMAEGPDFVVTRAAPASLERHKGRRFAASREPFAALMGGLSALVFPAEVDLGEGVRVSAGAPLSLGSGRWAVVLLGFGPDVDDEGRDTIVDMLRVGEAALRATATDGAAGRGAP